MSQYRRFRVEGGTYFFTVVTYNRLPILTNEKTLNLLHEAWYATERRHPFETIAICLLPDHLHCIWRLPDGDADYSTRWKEIKRHFTRGYVNNIGPGEARSESRIIKKEVAIWQRRFWEHTILDENDFENHLDYIHYNPIKHGYVNRAVDWQWSTFRNFVNEGLYDIDWAGGEVGRLQGYDFE